MSTTGDYDNHLVIEMATEDTAGNPVRYKTKQNSMPVFAASFPPVIQVPKAHKFRIANYLLLQSAWQARFTQDGMYRYPGPQAGATQMQYRIGLYDAGDFSTQF